MTSTPTPLARLLRPRSVAVVGASADPSKLTGRPVAYLRRHGFDGAIWPVNPRAAEIAGLPCFPRVADLPGAPDAAIVLLGAEHAAGAVAELSAIGTGAAIILAGGFGESGPDGAARQAALREAAGATRLLGPNTIGLVNVTDGIVLSATGALELHELPRGGVSLVSQSGGILGAVLSRAAARGVGLARLVATGNEADLDVADIVAHLAEDPATRVIALYLEGLRRPDAFRAAARLAADAGKRVVAFKVGRSEAGARAAVSHTGAMAGTERIYEAFFRACGVLRAERFSDLIDIPAALAAGRRAAGRRIAVLTSTGGAGALVADAAGVAGLSLPPPAPETAARIAAPLGAAPAEMAANPVDVTLAGVKPEVYQEAIAALLDSAEHDALAVVVGSSALANPDLAADALAAAQGDATKPMIAYVSPHAPAILAALNRRGVPAFDQPEACAAVLAALAEPTARLPPAGETPDPGPLPAGTLDEAESAALFARFGVPVAEARAVATPEEAADAARALAGAEGNVVLKIRDRRIPHKSDAGGVRVGVPAAAVAGEARAMLARVAATVGFAPEGLLVQRLAPRGVELILGLRREGGFGTALLLGLGGVAAELFGDTALRMLPVTREDLREMLGGLRGAKLLAGHRGAPPADMDALLDAVLAFAHMGEALGPHLVEAEVNPLFAGAGGAMAADGLAVLAAPPQ
ncbi:MAG: acetate--CoA ligase family protein [Acetobacteraceae bacterium]